MSRLCLLVLESHCFVLEHGILSRHGPYGGSCLDCVEGQEPKQAKTQGLQTIRPPCDRPGSKLTESDGKNPMGCSGLQTKPILLCLIINRKRLATLSLSLSLSLSLQATQVNNIQKYSIVSVEIKVINKSDYPPFFESRIYYGTVFVGLAPRSFVFHTGDTSSPLMITAADDDFPNVRNCKCTAFFLTASGLKQDQKMWGKGGGERQTRLPVVVHIIYLWKFHIDQNCL